VLEEVFVDFPFRHTRIEHRDADIEQLSLCDIAGAFLQRHRVRDEHLRARAARKECESCD